MSDYEDAIESLEDVSSPLALSMGLRHRVQNSQWDPDEISISSEVPGLHEVKVRMILCLSTMFVY